jgi:hypothetical protein
MGDNRKLGAGLTTSGTSRAHCPLSPLRNYLSDVECFMKLVSALNFHMEKKVGTALLLILWRSVRGSRSLA